MLFNANDFLKLLSFALAVVVEEDFKAERVVFVLSHGEAVVGQQEPVVSGPVTVEQLVALSVAGPVPRVHGKVAVCQV